MTASAQKIIHRGALLHFLADPQTHGTAAYEYFPDGALLIEQGRILRAAPAELLLCDMPDVPVIHHENSLILPGLVDTHVHYPQTDIIASYGESLLDWLNDYAFPAEMAFAERDHCQRIAERFIEQLLQNGTTSALVFATVHPQSVDCFFQTAQQHNLRMACGKTLMDCNAPPALCDTAASAYDDSRRLIEKWHRQGRLCYAVTPRFALTSSAAQLAAAGRLMQEYDDVLLHTHLSENLNELEAVRRLHPQAANYVEVYHQHGLVCERSLFAHSIHLSDEEWQRLAQQQARIAFCPTSNFMLGSGLFNSRCAQQHGVAVALGSDIGGGSSFSLLKVIEEAYKCARLRGDFIRPTTLWYWATLGGAHALQMDSSIGNFTAGKEADFIVLNAEKIPLLKRRLAQVKTLEEQLLLMAVLGDERLIQQVYIMGQAQYAPCAALPITP